MNQTDITTEEKVKLLYQIVKKIDERLDRLESKSDINSIGMIYTGSVDTTESKPAKYKRITPHLQELQAMYTIEDGEWERNFIQGILDFSGQTVTEKQYQVLQTMSQKVNFTKDLVTIR